MKKFLALLLCAAMCFAFAACGGKPSTESSDASDDSALQKYIESAQDELDSMNEAIKDLGMQFEFIARGNSLVFRYKYTEDMGDISLLKDNIEQKLEENASSFEETFSDLKQEVPSAESLIVEYFDMDGNLIVSREYKSGSAAGLGSAPDESPSEPDEASDDSDAMTLEKYIESRQDEIDSASEYAKENGLDLEYLARENSLVFSYQFLEDVGDTSVLKAGLEQALEKQASTLENALSDLKQEVPSAESLIVEYLDKDGNLIAFREYTGESEPSAENSGTEAPEEPSSEPDETPDDSNEMTLEMYLESIQDELDSASEDVREQGFDLEFLARGNSLVYRYQFLEDKGDTSVLKDSLEQYMDSMGSDLENVLSSMQQVVPSTESVIVEWLDMDGNLITSKEYK